VLQDFPPSFFTESHFPFPTDNTTMSFGTLNNNINNGGGGGGDPYTSTSAGTSNPFAMDSNPMRIESFAEVEQPIGGIYGHSSSSSSDGWNRNGSSRRKFRFGSDNNNASGRRKRRLYLAAGITGLALIVVIAIVAGRGGSKSSGSSNALGSGGGDGSLMNPNEVERMIRMFAVYGGNEFDSNPTSYQSQALRWMKANTYTNFSEIRIRQRYALACLYMSTYAVRTLWTDYAFGVGVPVLTWVNNRGWLSFDDECDWFGIECNDDIDGTPVVTGIKLANNILTGTFPAEVGLLGDSLIVLDIYNNYVYNVGDQEHVFLGQLTNLENLYYGSCSFQYDGIPPYIAKLTNLVEYDCSYTLHFGALDPSIFAPLTNLEYLYIGGNSFNSSIPDTIGNLPNLLYMYAEYADIIGDLSFMTSMPAIFELWMDRNDMLTGPLFSELGQLVTLESLSLTRCGLTGTIPTEFGLLTDMQQMWLYDNFLTGPVPTELSHLSSLKRLEMEMNELTGSVSDDVCLLIDQAMLQALEMDCVSTDTSVMDTNFVYDAKTVQCNCCTCCGPACADEQIQGSAGEETSIIVESNRTDFQTTTINVDQANTNGGSNRHRFLNHVSSRLTPSGRILESQRHRALQDLDSRAKKVILL
jgi:hypothetical protein